MAAQQLDPLIRKLIQRMHDPDPLVRLNAVGALRLHGARAVGAIPQLVEMLADPNHRVRAEARRALARLRQAAA